MAQNPILEKVYDPRSVEPAVYALWEQSGAFRSSPDGRSHERTFTMVIPPPNVTGALHLGHALNNTLQDILIRYHRMRGFNTLWQPGTDHAGIATQAVVERRIREAEGKSRHDLGRDELVKRIWRWKDEYERRIISQLKLMGCSCDWDRLRFTLDDGLARSVREMFFRLFKDGLIFRGKRLVNWDTQLQTAVSDDEVYYETVHGHFWHIKYPVIDPRPAEPQHVIIATTRPETMLGDTAVAVHPDPEGFFDRQEEELKGLWDRLSSRSAETVSIRERQEVESRLEALRARRESHLAHLMTLRDMARNGRMLRLPLVEREIPLIADEWADPTKGSGCVKITPAHDPNDYEVGLRNDLPMINVLTPDGKIAPIVEPDETKAPVVEQHGRRSVNAHSSAYEGLTFDGDGRRKVVADLEAKGLLDRVEDHEIEIGHSDRSKLPIEPYLSDQWFVKTADIDPSCGAEPRASAKRPDHDRAAAETGTEPRASACGSGSGGIRLGDGGRAPGLAQAAMDAVNDERIHVFPPRYAKSYLDWLGEKRDWCISRQLWWGHRIPVWTFRGATTEERAKQFQNKILQYANQGLIAYERFSNDRSERVAGQFCPTVDIENEFIREAEETGFRQDDDVLDTWFSSALWPFSTLGWPDETEHLKQYYPGSVLCTSRDIVTNWVARMVMFGLYAMGEVPFDHVYIHPKILDGRGETMSKSKGNGVDPVDVIHTHGADALRYSMADLCTETQDIRMPVEYVCPHCGRLTDQAAALKVEEQARKSRGQRLDRKLQPADCMRVRCADKACNREFATQWADDALKEELGLGRETSDKFDIGRNFCNKMWNAARFAFLNLAGAPCDRLAMADLFPEDRWILSRLSHTIRRYHRCVQAYQFSASVKELREFFWDSLCDWYIELTKPRLTPKPQAPALDAQRRGSAGADAEQPPEPRASARTNIQQPSGGPDPSGAVAKQVLAFCLDQVLRLWHPTIPFMTERLWQQLNTIAPRRGIPGVAELSTRTPLILASFPPSEGYPELEDEAIERVFGGIQNVVRAIRDLRAQCHVSPRQAVTATVALPDADAEGFRTHAHIVARMANVAALRVNPRAHRPINAGSVTKGSIRVFVHDISDDEAERARTGKVLEALEKQIAGTQRKLANEKFVANARPEVVEAERRRMVELTAQRSALQAHLAELETRR